MAKKNSCIPSDEELKEKVQRLEQVEEELARIRQQLEGVTEMARLAYWERDLINDIFTFTDQFFRIFRTSVEQVGGYTMSSEEYVRRFIHPDDQAFVRSEMQKTAESGHSRQDRQLEHRIVFPDGNT